MKIIISLLLLIFSFNLSAQADNCSAATVLNIDANCTTPTPGTTAGATQTIAGCVGTADDDVWYQFVATSTSHQIIVQPNAGLDPVVQLFSGACATLISLVCKDNTGDGEAEILNYNGLNIGETYRVRVYHYLIGSGTGNFTICVTNPAPAPSNDLCGNATPLNVNASCTFTNATTDGASQSLVGCSGTADDDVWFSFVATNSLQNITVDPIDDLDLVFQVYSGTCTTLNTINCVDNTFSNQAEQSDIVGLIPGQTYFIRVYDYYQGTTGDFQICITGTATAVPTNDEPCNAIQLPPVTATCQFSSFTTVSATATDTVNYPISNCAGGSGAAIGGYNTTSSQDVWFAITVPASGNIDVTAQPNGGAGSITDGVMALYSGNCSSMTLIACGDDNLAYPGTGNDLLPLISESGLTPGTTVYLRYWDWGVGSGTFGICVSTATNDECANALYICDINGYSASTSASYTPDRPDNMHGNNEDASGVNLQDGTNSGGVFGQGGPWGTGSPFIDVNIENNSWIKFTASAITATLNVSIYDCWVGNYPSGGLQMQVFEGDNCTNFVPVSNFEESSTGFIITANGLTIGNDYYLMIDGYAGDICNYTITAETGVQFPNIEAVTPICEGESVVLNAPPGATSYDWQHSGETTPSVSVTPSTTQTYYCEVTGLCDYKQTLEATVEVKQNPTVSINNSPTIEICDGLSTNLTAVGADTYVWSTTQTNSTISVSPTTLTTYTVIGTTNGCSNNATVDVEVNPNPTLSVNPTGTDSDCGGSNGSLNGATATGSPTITYTWTNSAGATIGSSANLSGIPAGAYFLEVEDGNGCISNFGGFSISNPGAPIAPTLSVDDNTPCNDGSSQITITNIDPSATYNWSGPNSFSSSATSVVLNNISASNVGNYCVSATVAGCTGPTACENISISPPPTIDIVALNNDSTICLEQGFEITAGGASSYNWTGPNGFNSSGATQTFTNVTVNNQGYYVVNAIDGNGCTASDSIQIEVLPLPVLNINTTGNNDTYCQNTVANITVSGATSYTWIGPDGFSENGSSVTILNVGEQNEGYYTVSAIDNNGCQANDSIMLLIAPNPTISAPSDTTICPSESLTLHASGGTTYNWSGPAGFSSDQQNPLVSTSMDFANSGLYTVVVVDANGCSGSDSTNVEVTNDGDCLFIPNLVTPNLDGLNDLWIINGIEKYTNAEVEIYNRWGNLVYSASPYNNDWDATVNKGATIDGKDGKVPVGTYFYIVNLNEDDYPPFKGYLEVEY